MHRLAGKALDNQNSITIIESAKAPFAFVVVDRYFPRIAPSAVLSTTQKARAIF